jgi:hypothetical protein
MNILVTMLCLIIVCMAMIIIRLNRKLRFLKDQFSGKTNGLSGKDLFENITKSKALYKDLLIEFHPDKFTLDDNRKKRAEELSSQIAESKSSYRDLILIAQSVKNEIEFSNKFINNYPEIFK